MRPCLITAGATRNPVDAIRYLSAHASGRTGVHLGARLHTVGRSVHLLGSPEALLRAGDPAPFQTEAYGSTHDLHSRIQAWVQAHPQGAMVHSSAVGDYAAQPSDSKITSGQNTLTLTLHPTPKILDAVRGFGLLGPLVSFKAAAPETTDDALEAIARAQLRRTGSDRVFANVIGRTSSGVMLVSEQSCQRFDTRSEAISRLLAYLVDATA